MMNEHMCVCCSCYRLKLFLEKFSIKSAVLNAELPANSRLHCLQQFNKVCIPPVFTFLSVPCVHYARVCDHRASLTT